ncbi:CorA family divalent cation transporter [Helcococcus bovis]|uniref:CorA family divalent cation transporter n=1 Tax=Helcococcus bovis TaxID=3153252 RepID=UPI0038BDDB59
MINKYSIVEKKIEKYNENSNFKWIEMIHPNNQEIEEIYTTYNLPKDYITDITDKYKLPRTEGLDDDSPNLLILNYPIKMSNTENHPNAFWYLILISFGLSFAIIYLLKKNDYL